jgi:RNA polymerase sigma factor (sigma-70 family)
VENSEQLSADAYALGNLENRHGAFSTTHWSMVLTAGNGNLAGATSALEQLCGKYWYPIYAFVRRRGSNVHEAEDLTQAFFAHLLEKETLKQVDRQKGKFRTFLLASLTNFLNNDWRKTQTLKRGGQHQIISLDETVAENRYQLEAADLAAPEILFERRWALTLLEQVFTRLKQEYTASKKAGLFIQLESLITGEITVGQYAELSLALGMKEEAVRVALSRARRRFGELLRHEIAQTVASPTDVEDEIRHLFAAIST